MRIMGLVFPLYLQGLHTERRSSLGKTREVLQIRKLAKLHETFVCKLVVNFVVPQKLFFFSSRKSFTGVVFVCLSVPPVCLSILCVFPPSTPPHLSLTVCLFVCLCVTFCQNKTNEWVYVGDCRCCVCEGLYFSIVQISGALTDGRNRTQCFLLNPPNGFHLSTKGELLTCVASRLDVSCVR